MRIALQDRGTLLYFQQPDQWTAEISEAAYLEHIRAALEFARQTKRTNLDAILVFGEHEYHIHLDLLP